METRHIALWSGPRNVSTALMYAFAQRRDTTVIDEPLYAHYLRVSGALHPGRETVLAAQNPDGNLVMRELLGAHWDTPLVFHKQMAHHLVDLDPGFLDAMEHVFLIRPPEEMLPSLARILETVELRDTGLPAQSGLFDLLAERGHSPLCVDGRALRNDPEVVLRALCRSLEIPFDPGMLQWPAGPRPEDGVWARWWYQQVHASTGFRPAGAAPASLPEHVAHLLEPCRALYEKLSRHNVHREVRHGTD
jgi:hypothetical protein